MGIELGSLQLYHWATQADIHGPYIHVAQTYKYSFISLTKFKWFVFYHDFIPKIIIEPLAFSKYLC